MKDTDALLARIERLRDAGAARSNPARLAQLQALLSRLAGQREEVRAVLHARIAAAVDQLTGQLAESSEPPGESNQAPGESSESPAFLPASAVTPHPLQARAKAALKRTAAVPAPVPAPASLPRRSDPSGNVPELQSVIRFRRSWASGRAHESVEAASARRPNNAGPLNSHMLVLQSLDMMRESPGDYLRRFLTHVESLQWLEAAQAQAASSTPRQKPKRAKPQRGS